MRDPYQLLAVPRSATADDIKKSFRLLAKRLHPDANNDPKAVALFADLNAAYAILGNEEKRNAFDRGEIDASGKPTRQAVSHITQRHRITSSLWHIVTCSVIAVSMPAATLPLIIRSLTPQAQINPNDDGETSVLSVIGSSEQHVGSGQTQQLEHSVQSEPRLILQQLAPRAAGDTIPLGVQVGGEAVGLAVEIRGLPSGTRISAGRPLPGGGWRILATDVDNATIHPPLEFSGAIDLSIELRRIDDTVVDHGSVPLEWMQKRLPIALASPESAVAAVASESAASKATSESLDDKASATAAPADENATQQHTDSQSHHESIELLIGRSEKLLSEGDAEAARILLRPAAEARDAQAGLALGATYDPIMLAILQAHGVAGDVYMALDWYKKASEFGSLKARERFNLLAAMVNGGELVAVGPTEVLRKVERGTAARDTANAVTSAKPKRHIVHPRMHVSALPEPPTDPYGVYVAGARVGVDPDPNIRTQLIRDDASRGIRTDVGARQSATR
jgi:hypothetical protein